MTLRGTRFGGVDVDDAVSGELKPTAFDVTDHDAASADPAGPTGPGGPKGAPSISYDIEQAAGAIHRSGFEWGTSPGGVITFAFAASLAAYDPDDYEPDMGESNYLDGFSAFSTAQKNAARAALQFWSDVLNVSFQEVTATAPTSAQIMFGNTTTGPGQASAFLALPGSTLAGDVWINPNQASNFQFGFGQYGMTTLIHEIGHALGLEHPSDYDAEGGGPITYDSDADYIEDSLQYSIMSYFDGVEVGFDHVGSSYEYPMTPMLHDVAAAQSIYGAGLSTRTGNTTYGFNAPGGIPSVFDFDQNPYPVLVIWDGGGIDTLDFSGFSSSTVLDLRGGRFSSTPSMQDNVAIALGAVIENAVGGSSADTITGNDVANTIWGGSGSDTISGGYGSDVLFGEAGNDTLNAGPGGTRGSAPDLIANGATGNVSIGTALSLDGAFDLIESIEIRDSTTIPHATVIGTGAGATAYFSFTVTSAGQTLTVDIDGGSRLDEPGDMDAWVALLTSGGTILATDDDNVLGADAGSSLSYTMGSDSVSQDSFLTFTFGAAGTYVIALGTWTNGLNEGDLVLGGAVPSGATYRLHVSLTGATVVPDSGGGGDWLDGGPGNDTLNGGSGVDTAAYNTAGSGVTVNLGLGGAQNTGGAGTDTLSSIENIAGSNFNDTLTGDGGANYLEGRNGDDTLTGGAGDDFLQGNAGMDTLNGGANDDRLEGGAGDDVLNAGGGADLARGGGGDDVIHGAGGDDVLRGLADDDVIFGEADDDRLEGAAGADDLFGGAGNDTVIGGDGNDELWGDIGDDDMNGSAGDDQLRGEDGADVLNGNGGVDDIDGGDGNDVLFGGFGNDVMTGGLGDDELRGGGDDDTQSGGDGDDDLYGITGNDTLMGEADNDRLFGGDGLDALFGGAGNDELRGANGDDALDGGLGADLLFGGAGADDFVFTSILDSGTSNGTRDEVRDFSRADGDTIDVSAIDADTTVGGDQAFSVVGAFSNTAGEMTLAGVGGGVIRVALDVDGDGAADMEFDIMGQSDLNAGDFVL